MNEDWQHGRQAEPAAAPAPPPRAPAGRTVRTGRHGPQIVSTAGHRWSDEAEEQFFGDLAATGNVTWAARRVGFSREAIYARRRRDPVFHERWQAALAEGVARVEMLLVRRAEELLEGRPPDPAAPFPQMSVADAIAIVKLHRATAAGLPAKYPGWRGRPRSLEEVHGSILKKLDAIDRSRGKP